MSSRAPRRRQLLLLVAELQKLQAKFPDLQQEIQNDIDDHLRQAERTRAADKQAIISLLREWEDMGLTVEEIISDTGLSEWTVRRVLGEPEQADPPALGFRDRPQELGRPVRVYFLTAKSN